MHNKTNRKLLKLNTVKQKRNESHKKFFEDTNRWVISYGGAGSAKSYSTAQKILLRVLEEEKHKFLICRKVAKTLRVSVFQLFKDLISDLDLFDDFKINKTDMTITYLPNESTLLFFGLDDIEKLKSIQGITSIWIEEASETEKGDILELNRRLRGFTPYYKQIIITFNPISHLHWLKAHFFDNPMSKASIYKTTYLNNSFIDEEYKIELEDIKNYDVQQYNIYALGEWGVLDTNIIYHNFNYKKHTTALGLDDFEVLHCGIDFNIGGCVVVVCGIRDNKVYIVDGFAAYDTDAIVVQLQSSKYNGKDFILYPDASGKNRSSNASQTNIQILETADFLIDAPNANPLVRDRINCVNKMLATDRIFINDRVEKLVKSLQVQSYKPNGEPEKWDEHKGGAVDDWNDSFGYFISRKFNIKGYAKFSGGFKR